jgi:Dyp-type peroxidase family
LASGIPGQRGGVDAILIVAADDEEQLDQVVVELAEVITQQEGTVVFQERGATLPGEMRGREHFGFKDGASQPAIVGYDRACTKRTAGSPAGEFVLGYADAAGPAPELTPTWRNGSFLVFRRLAQDVSAFRNLFAAPIAGAEPPLTPEQLQAKAVGRWTSGAPVEKYPSGDPGPGHADNDFQYQAADDAGLTVPTWGHIRKTNPRDETLPAPVTVEDEPMRHRMLRRGIPYGLPLSTEAHQDDGADRGLHFIAIVVDVVRQFEFVQRTWMNNENFPKGAKPPAGGNDYTPPSQGVPGDGPDPIVGEGNAGKTLQLHQAAATHQIQLTGDVVKVTAGEYFFCPSIDALKVLGG